MNWAARSFWVAQQFETAIFEGLPARRARAAVAKATEEAAVSEIKAAIAEQKAASEALECLHSKIAWSGRVPTVEARRPRKARQALLDANRDEAHPI